MQITPKAPTRRIRRALVCAAQLVLATLATRADAQAGKISSTGLYETSLACGGGLADAPDWDPATYKSGMNYTSAGLQVWDGSGKELSRPVIYCGAKPVVVGGTGAATVHWVIFLFDQTYAEVKQCESTPNAPIGGGRFTCKAGGNLWATLTFKPK